MGTGGGLLDQGRPSATAQRVAERRAAHQLLEQPRVFDDPMALRVIGQQAAQALRRDLDEQRTPWNQALRAFMAARSRYAEDRLAIGKLVVGHARIRSLRIGRLEVDELLVHRRRG